MGGGREMAYSRRINIINLAEVGTFEPSIRSYDQ